MNTGEDRCPGCNGMGAVATEMGCFGPNRMGRCDTCKGTGNAPPCWICSELKASSVRSAKFVYSGIPICREHYEKKCEHGRVKLLGCPACLLNQQKALTRAEVLEEAATFCSNAGHEKNEEQTGRDYDAFACGSASGCLHMAVKLGELAKKAREELKKFEE